MPHQCLKCGAVFADGSPQILRGCPDCGGTKFFFTEKKMSDNERNKLKEQANKDIKYLIHEMLTGQAPPMIIEGESSENDEWVQIRLGSDSELGKSSIEKQVQVKQDMMKSVEDLLFKEKESKKRFRTASKTDVKKKPEKKPKKIKAKEEVTKPKKKEAKKEDKVAVITIKDEGVYEIDIKRLLEDSPIIVQKDGSYMVHLPSVFKKARKKSSSV